MIKSRKDSEIQIWGADYINSPAARFPIDVTKVIIQIEPTSSNDYIVEVVNEREE